MADRVLGGVSVDNAPPPSLILYLNIGVIAQKILKTTAMYLWK